MRKAIIYADEKSNATQNRVNSLRFEGMTFCFKYKSIRFGQVSKA